MDRFSVTGEDLRKFYSPETSLDKVFRDIEKDLSVSQMVVCQFIVNGLALTEADEFKFSKVRLLEVEQLEYLVDKSSSLVHGVLDGWIDSLPELINMSEVFAKKIKSGNFFTDGKFIKNIYELIENCEYLVSSVQSIRTLLGDHIAAAFLEWERDIDHIRVACKLVLEHLEAKNQKELAATIEYDLSHALQCLHDELVKLNLYLNGQKGVSKASPQSEENSSPKNRKKFFN